MLAPMLAVSLAWADGTQPVVHIGFAFKRGQLLYYRVEQATTATDMLGDSRASLATRVEQIRCWQVRDVEGDGTALVQLWVQKLKVSQRLPSGEQWEYDSTAAERASPPLRQRLDPFVGRPVALLRVDSRGSVVGVVHAVEGWPTHFEQDPPFVVILPGRQLAMGQVWQRNYAIVLDPPLGTGQRYLAQQQYQVRSLDNGTAIIGFSTTLAESPHDATHRLALLQFLPQGEAVFDLQSGLVVSARFVSSGTVEGHQGQGSRYELHSEVRLTLLSR
jgi:hypothetical protein